MRIGVLASGSGTLLEAILADGIPVEVVITDRPCRAVEVAESAGVEAVVVARDSFGADFDRDGYTDRVVAELRARDVELVVMAGFGTVMPKAAAEFPGRLLNTHPALLPSFKGWHAVREALAARVKVTGCTVHIATEVMDEGPILSQEAVVVEPDDTEDSLHERIKEVERRIYPATIRRFIEGTLP
ncbi:phosphoribosylglycinamide formyltransferase [Actinomarinicola tropica]|uniref:Phosphoribosylglycinamide formyltransferase n=1 Tax=Actinomarinicola tropica TaxID=2789776 RepID=A0A5Q2RAN2_9ACTN|nr:phosphoribosylglycinamide formyltransferase [Actinomarinicola tropica]QGG93929.1 phosphoribosylglycinamide formyltransferase [Actinomarinicola tropica]